MSLGKVLKERWSGIAAWPLAVMVGGVWATFAEAKEVRLEWKPVSIAVSYELRVFRAQRAKANGDSKKEDQQKEVVRKLLTSPEWKGDLAAGVFFYQIRAIDRVKRPGAWSRPMPLVVMPSPPEDFVPQDGTKWIHYHPQVSKKLSWNPVPGADFYEVELLKENRLYRSEKVSQNELQWVGLAEGTYEWKVRVGLTLFPQKTPEGDSVLIKNWTSKWSEVNDLKIRQARLDAPVPVSPLGNLAPSRDRKLKLKWKSVDGAEAYEVRYVPASPKGFEGNASAEVIRVKDNSLEVKLDRNGKYLWKVRALAHLPEGEAAQDSSQTKKMDRSPSSATPQAVGPDSSVAQFNLDPNADYFEGSGFVALSTLFAPYTYSFVSPSTGSSGDQSSASLTGRLSGEYWFRPQWGAGLSIDGTAFMVDGSSYIRKNYEADLKFRMTFGDPKRSWALAPRLGFEGRDYVGLYRRNRQTGSLQTLALGPHVGLDFRKQLLDQLSLGIRFSYFMPLTLRGDTVDSITGDASYRNWSVGIQGLYWISRHWGVGLGAYIEKRSISYQVQGYSGNPEVYFMDGNYFFGSLIYSFGR